MSAISGMAKNYILKICYSFYNSGLAVFELPPDSDIGEPQGSHLFRIINISTIHNDRFF